jgi:hypothetical protein
MADSDDERLVEGRPDYLPVYRTKAGLFTAYICIRVDGGPDEDEINDLRTCTGPSADYCDGYVQGLADADPDLPYPVDMLTREEYRRMEESEDDGEDEDD